MSSGLKLLLKMVQLPRLLFSWTGYLKLSYVVEFGSRRLDERKKKSHVCYSS